MTVEEVNKALTDLGLRRRAVAYLTPTGILKIQYDSTKPYTRGGSFEVTADVEQLLQDGDRRSLTRLMKPKETYTHTYLWKG